MINSTVTTKISAAFLATVLFAGIIALSHPSFMVGAQAVPEYGMDSYDKKSNGKDVSIKKVKCNNINVNVNGLTLNTTSVPFLSDLLGSEAHADEGDNGASSYGKGGSYGSDGSYGDKKSGSDKSFKFICINNNNNNVGGGNVTVPPVPPVDGCLDCFTPQNEGGELPPPFVELLEAYLNFFQPTFNGVEDVGSILELCQVISAAAAADDPVTEAQIQALLEVPFPGQSAPGQIQQIIDCLEEAGLLAA
jgi:hypothetical protein